MPLLVEIVNFKIEPLMFQNRHLFHFKYETSLIRSINKSTYNPLMTSQILEFVDLQKTQKAKYLDNKKLLISLSRKNHLL